MSFLGAEIGEKHYFNTCPEGWCNFYGRDRGETGVSAKASQDIGALSALTQGCGGEWLYVFNGHRWQCAKVGLFIGAPASTEPTSLESVDYWIHAYRR